MAASLKVLPRPLFVEVTRVLSRHKGIKYVRLCHAAARTASSRRWQLHGSVCLQRYPVVTQEMTDMEQRYSDYLQSVETASSLLSNHELQIIADIERMKKIKEEQESGNRKVSKSEENISTATEMEDAWQQELEQFSPADRLTAADQSGDMTTSHRRLDRKLVLIVKQKLGADSEPVWTLPQARHHDGESMRETAERALGTCCGENIQATFMGNAPCGYYKYKLPEGKMEEYGVKEYTRASGLRTLVGGSLHVFCFKATYNQGDVVPTDNVIEHKWVTLEELKDYFSPSALDDFQDFIVEF